MSVRRLLVVSMLAVAAGATTVAAPASANHNSDRRNLSALLTGRQVVGPPAGDSNAWGVTNVQLRPNQGRICFTMLLSKVDGTGLAVRLRSGRAGEETNAVDVALGSTRNGISTGCATAVAEATVRAVMDNPRRHYIEVTSTAFADGAVRGQLQRQNSN